MWLYSIAVCRTRTFHPISQRNRTCSHMCRAYVSLEHIFMLSTENVYSYKYYAMLYRVVNAMQRTVDRSLALDPFDAYAWVIRGRWSYEVCSHSTSSLHFCAKLLFSVVARVQLMKRTWCDVLCWCADRFGECPLACACLPLPSRGPVALAIPSRPIPSHPTHLTLLDWCVRNVLYSGPTYFGSDIVFFCVWRILVEHTITSE